MRIRRLRQKLVATTPSRAIEVVGALSGAAAVTAAIAFAGSPLGWLVVPMAALALFTVVRRRGARWNRADLHSIAAALLGSAVLGSLLLPIGGRVAFVGAVLAVASLCAALLLRRQGALAATLSLAAIAAVAYASESAVEAVTSLALVLAAGGLGTALRGKSDLADSDDLPDSLFRRGRPDAVLTPVAQQRMMEAAGRSVRGSVRRILSLLRASMRGHSALALWINHRTHTAVVRDAETASDHLIAGPFSDRAGLLGILRKQAEPFMMNHVRNTDALMPWYESGRAPAHVLGMALYDEGMLVGYLILDRRADLEPFDEVDAIALQAAAEEVIAAVHTERLVVEACQSRHEMSMLYEAADAFNSALTPEDVCAVAEELVQRIAPSDFFAVTSFNEDLRNHQVFFADGDPALVERISEREFGDDASLAALAVRRNHPLPYHGRLENPNTPIFGSGGELPELHSLVVFPMTMGQRCVGTLAIGAHRDHAYGVECRDQLRMIVNYASAALANALSYSQMVQRATTDGMTGLTNHRTFKERGAEALLRAERSGRPCTFIITDIDHFKSVNDTHGHAVGDRVIKGVAQAIRETLRKVDLGARYGGEEFAILLEDTETDSGIALAERLRTAVQSLEFEGAEERLFRVTLSLGVATYPAAADNLNELIEQADSALYQAKRGGRNQTAVFEPAVFAAA